MQSNQPIRSVSKTALWAGRTISGLAILFFIFDGVTKVIRIPEVVQANLDLGYSEALVMPIGLLMLLCTLLYAIPLTSVLGALLLTAYLGGAVATHVRAGSGLFPIMFTVVFGILVWLGLYLREPRLHTLLPLSQTIGGMDE